PAFSASWSKATWPANTKTSCDCGWRSWISWSGASAPRNAWRCNVSQAQGLQFLGFFFARTGITQKCPPRDETRPTPAGFNFLGAEDHAVRRPGGQRHEYAQEVFLRYDQVQD